MRLRILGVLAMLAFLPGCSSWVPTVANNGLNYGINVGRTLSADRSLFNVLDDLAIKNAITDAFLDEALLLDVSTDVYQGMVMLTGFVRDAETRQKAENLTRQTDGVRELFNEIQVTDENWLLTVAKDLLMETALTTKLVWTEGVNSVNYRWRAVNGVVYFMGMAKSRAELDKVISLARLNGVRRIVSHVFLTDHLVVDVPLDVSVEAKTETEKNKADEEVVKADAKAESKAEAKVEIKPDEVKTKSETKKARKKTSPRPDKPRSIPSTSSAN